MRIESGEIIYESVPIDAKAIFIDVLAMYYNDFFEKGLEPTVIFPDKPFIINGDEQGLKRVFSNRSESMEKEDLNYIFDRFYTKDKSRNKKTTGLGLSIAKEIVKQLGGKINAYYDNGMFLISVSFPR